MSTFAERKRRLDDDLKKVEREIFDLEEKYLEDTNQHGNIVKGWDGYLNSKPKALTNAQRRVKILDKHRIFTNSSTTADWILQSQEETVTQEEPVYEEPKRGARAVRKNEKYVVSDDDDDDY